ncbi:RNA polymerase II-associated [Globomyces pollinis-pini]|nr:RNA polymerase II-associated [Globomyces pollinis-pini]
MERLDLSFENQVNFIKNSFDLAKKADLKSLKHPKNPELTATEIFPIFPDFEFWSTPYFLSTYDQDPINKSVLNLNPEDHVIALEESLLKPIRNNTENWLTYYAPTAASVEKLKRKRKLEDEDFVDDQEYELSFQKDFDQKIEPSSTYPFFLELREDQGGAFYSTINNHLKLRKRRALSKQDAYYEDEAQKHTRVLLTHRKLKAVEKQQRYARMKELIEVDGHEILAAYEEALLNDPEDLEENGDNDSPKQDIPITDELDL